MSNIKVKSNDSGGQSPGSYYQTREAVVDPQNEEDLSKWSANLGISKKEFKEAIALYGVVISDIRKGLLQNKNKSA